MNISKRSQLKFAELASGLSTLSGISQVFESERFEPHPTFKSDRTGQRRSFVDEYHAAIDLTEPEQQRRLLRVYLDALESWCVPDADGNLPKDARDLISSLQKDGVLINGEGRLATAGPSGLDLSIYADLTNVEVLEDHLRSMKSGLSEDPAGAIGSAKELAESVCKLILDDYGIAYPKAAKLLELYKAASIALRINRSSVPNSAKGSQSAQRVLQNLATMIQSLAELRDELGRGHGRNRLSPALERHAKLACNASRTLVEFVLDTWQTRKAQLP